jgi:segregation and condensation protein B
MSRQTRRGLEPALARVHGVLGQPGGLPATRGPVRRQWLFAGSARAAFAPRPGAAQEPQVAGDSARGLRGDSARGLRGDSARGLRGDELARLEAALFLAREPLTTRRLAKLARLPDATRARALLRELRSLQEESGSAIRVEPVAGGFQLFTRAPFGPWVKRLLEAPPGGRLSGTALETLAIVAYRQPVTRAEIEAIRGAGSEEMLRQLMERDLVAIGGRAEELGRPNVYVTTRRFLAFFGLSRLEDLPELAAILPADPAATPAAPPDGDGATP